jgi:hypothetical protein
MASPDDDKSRLLQQAELLQPWYFRFEIDGLAFGGQVPRDTEKTGLFSSWARKLGQPVKTIIEFGSHEGSHSLQLASIPEVERVIGLEGRPDNIVRARFIKRIFRADSIEFHQCNLEKLDPPQWPICDAVFCAGLLYHLPRPWEFVPKLSMLCKSYLFLDTHYASSVDERVEGYSGKWTGEGPDPLSGLSKRSFWLSFKDITRLLMENGFIIRFVRDYESFSRGSRVFIFAEKAKHDFVEYQLRA